MHKGFTLIEIMVAMSIFIVVMTISLGAILGIFSDNSTAQQIKSSMDNVNSGLETLSRELRFGTEWHCGAIGSDITTPQECQSLTPGTQISFLSSDGYRTVYRLSGTTIQKSLDAGVTFVPITSSEVIISQFTLVVVGLGTGYQPKAYIFVRGAAGTTHPSMFTLQSIVSRRVLNTGSFTPSQGGSASSCSDTGLLGCWLFDAGSGSTVIDSAGNGHSGTLLGSTSWVAGQSGTAVSFPGNGSSDEVDINGTTLGATSVTVSAWFKLTGETEATYSGAFDQLGAVIFSTRTGNTDVSPSLVVTPANGGSGNGNLGISFACDSGALAAGAKGATSLVNGQWYHVVGVYTAGGGGNWGGTWDVYLNGVKNNSSSNNFYLAGTCAGSFNGSTWYLGQAPMWQGESSVVVDSVRVYNRALSAAEVAALP